VSRSDDRASKRKGRVVTKDVVILPHDSAREDDGTYTVPSTAQIANLTTKRMAGKICFNSTDSAQAVCAEIVSLFGTFPFLYLQVFFYFRFSS
jgi:hypothetical protein